MLTKEANPVSSTYVAHRMLLYTMSCAADVLQHSVTWVDIRRQFQLSNPDLHAFEPIIKWQSSSVKP
jgi:hypothetical protein